MRITQLTVIPQGITNENQDFRTFLEILSFVLAGKPTDTNCVHYTSKTKKKQELLMTKILPALDKDQPRKITTPKAMKSTLR